MKLGPSGHTPTRLECDGAPNPCDCRDGLQIIYGDEAETIAHFVVRQCRERHDAQGNECGTKCSHVSGREKVWCTDLDKLI